MRRMKEISIPVEKATGMKPEDLAGKIVTGVLADRDYPEYCEMYAEVMKKAGYKEKDGESG